MLDLQIPINLGGKIYDVLIAGLRGEWDLRNRKIEVCLGPGRKRGNSIILGTKEVSAVGTRVLTAPIFSTLTIQDSSPPDPSYALIFEKLQELIGAIEAAVVTHPSLQEQVYQAGEEEVPLTCSFAPYAPDAFQLEEKIKSNLSPQLERKPE